MVKELYLTTQDNLLAGTASITFSPVIASRRYMAFKVRYSTVGGGTRLKTMIINNMTGYGYIMTAPVTQIEENQQAIMRVGLGKTRLLKSSLNGAITLALPDPPAVDFLVEYYLLYLDPDTDIGTFKY